ncbi:MAG: prepilin-type N-terminal cleavage/methylation domain-containing protein [Thermoanaerobaculum sp.]
MTQSKGVSLVELLVVLGLVALLAGIASPQLGKTADRAHLAAAGARLLTDTQRCQSLAAQRLAKVGLLFDLDERGRFYVVVADGNGNGVSRRDYLAGRDRIVAGPVYFRDFGARVRLGVSQEMGVPQPGGEGLVPESGLQVGGAGILSFSPGLGATAGSVYLSSGRQVLALRVTSMGVVRLFHYNEARRVWEPARF